MEKILPLRLEIRFPKKQETLSGMPQPKKIKKVKKIKEQKKFLKDFFDYNLDELSSNKDFISGIILKDKFLDIVDQIEINDVSFGNLLIINFKGGKKINKDGDNIIDSEGIEKKEVSNRKRFVKHPLSDDSYIIGDYYIGIYIINEIEENKKNKIIKGLIFSHVREKQNLKKQMEILLKKYLEKCNRSDAHIDINYIIKQKDIDIFKDKITKHTFKKKGIPNELGIIKDKKSWANYEDCTVKIQIEDSNGLPTKLFKRAIKKFPGYKHTGIIETEKGKESQIKEIDDELCMSIKQTSVFSSEEIEFSEFIDECKKYIENDFTYKNKE